MTVSARERRHFEAVGKAKEAERTERLHEALARHPLESMRLGLALGDVDTDAQVEAALDARAVGQAELSRRARALGMRGDRARARKAP